MTSPHPAAENPPTRPPRKKWPWFLGGAVAAALMFVIVTAVAVFISSGTAPTSQSSQATSPSSYSYAQPASVEPEVPEPTAKDYTVDLAVLTKRCFGSAGCNVVVEPKLTFVGETQVWDCDITYSVSGDESGELIETAYSQGGSAYRVDHPTVQTKNSKVVPKATVTSVSCRKP